MAAEEGPRLATPTDEAPTVRQEAAEPPPPKKPSNQLDLADPGYVIGHGWSKGDSWYYVEQEDRDRYSYRRVADVLVENGTTRYVLEESWGIPGNYPKQTMRIGIDGDNWTRLITTDGQSNRILYEPPAPNLRFHRNGTFEYYEVGQGAGLRWRDHHIVNSYYVGTETVKLSWGDSKAAIIEHREIITPSRGSEREVLVRHWVDREFRNDVAYEIDEKDFYLLEGARINGRLYGHIPPFV